jgi:hypothetical protein
MVRGLYEIGYIEEVPMELIYAISDFVRDDGYNRRYLSDYLGVRDRLLTMGNRLFSTRELHMVICEILSDWGWRPRVITGIIIFLLYEEYFEDEIDEDTEKRLKAMLCVDDNYCAPTA